MRELRNFTVLFESVLNKPSRMQPIDEETLRWNRKNATILGTVAIVLLVVIIFTVFEFAPEDPGYPMLFSGLVFIPAFFFFSHIWIKWRRKQRAKERGLSL